MRRGQSIRSDLGAHREVRLHHRHRIGTESFGIYRPLTPSSQKEIQEVTGFAIKKITEHLDGHRKVSADLQVAGEMGVTFVHSRAVRRALGRGALLRGFEPSRVRQSLEDFANTQPESLEVSLSDFRWFGNRNRSVAGRKLVSTFAINDIANAHLTEQATAIEDILHNANGNEIHVEVPDHATFLTYGRQGDMLDLSARHRREVSRIIDQQFYVSGIESITLGSIVVGTSYRAPSTQMSIAH